MGNRPPARVFPTPDEAALADFDPRYASVVRTKQISEDEVEVELSTNEEPYLYPYFVRCHRTPDGWVEGSSHN